MDYIASDAVIDRHATLDFADQDADNLTMVSKFKKHFQQLKKKIKLTVYCFRISSSLVRGLSWRRNAARKTKTENGNCIHYTSLRYFRP